MPALYEELLAHAGDVDEVAARLPAQLGDRRALAQEIVADLTKKGLLTPDDVPVFKEGNHDDRIQG